MLSALLALALLAPTQTQVVHVPSGPAGSCTHGSVDLQYMLFATNYHNKTCTSTHSQSYTLADSGSYSEGNDNPNGTVAQFNGTIESGDFFGLNNNIRSHSGLDTCVLDIDMNTPNDTDDATMEIVSIASILEPSTAMADGCVGFEFWHDNSVAEFADTFPYVFKLGAANSGTGAASVYFAGLTLNTPDNQMRLYFEAGVGQITTINTTSDASSCCGGSGCDALLDSYARGKWTIMEACWRTSTANDDFVRWYIDGCTGGNLEVVNQSWSTFDLHSTDVMEWGNWFSNNSGEWNIGRVWATNGVPAACDDDQDATSRDACTYARQLASDSSGTVSVTDGDVCFCGNVNGGTDCP